MGKKRVNIRNNTNMNDNLFSPPYKVGAIYQNTFAKTDDMDSNHLQNLKDIFKNKIEPDVIDLVYQDLKNVDDTLDVLLKWGEETPVAAAASATAQRPVSSSLFQDHLLPCQDSKLVNDVALLVQQNVPVLVILRGLPGSGKSTLARQLCRSARGAIFSTDDYFSRNGTYDFQPQQLSEAHAWNQQRALQGLKSGVSPIIIDNTNTEEWEIKPYVSMGLRHGYKMILAEPETPWKTNVKYLAKNNAHGVSQQKLKQMLERYDFKLTINSIVSKLKDNHFFAERPEETPKKDERSINTEDRPYASHKSKSLEDLVVKEEADLKSSKEISKSESDMQDVPGLLASPLDVPGTSEEVDSSSPELDSGSLFSSHSSNQGWEAVTDEFTWRAGYPAHWGSWEAEFKPGPSQLPQGPKPSRLNRMNSNLPSTILESPSPSSLSPQEASVRSSSCSLSSEEGYKGNSHHTQTEARAVGRVVKPRPYKTLDSPPSLSCISPTEKSTLTEEEPLDSSQEEKVSLIQAHFPVVPRKEICHLLKLCRLDPSWVTSILSDSQCPSKFAVKPSASQAAEAKNEEKGKPDRALLSEEATEIIEKWKLDCVQDQAPSECPPQEAACTVGEIFNFNTNFFENSELVACESGTSDYLNSPLLITESRPSSQSSFNDTNSPQLLKLVLPPTLAKDLIQKFGNPLETLNTGNLSESDLTLELDDCAAEVLFYLWTDNLRRCCQRRSKDSSCEPSPPPPSIEQIQPESLQEIMDNELAKKLDREQRMALEQSQKVKWGTWHIQRQELYKLYPGVDEDVLDELLDSTGSNLKKCVKLLDDPMSRCIWVSADPSSTISSESPHKKYKELRNREEYSHLLISPDTLDLHGLFLPEAMRTLRTFFHDKQAELLRSSHKKSIVKVITGIGKHSPGRPKLLPAILQHLNRNRYIYEEENPGLIKITFRRTQVSK